MTTKKPNSRGVLILFYAESDEAGWENRRNPLGTLTDYLKEHQNRQSYPEIPQPGYRLPQIKRNLTTDEPDRLDSRDGDWIVTRVHRYSAMSGNCEWEETVICYCQYQPVTPQWERVPRLEEISQEKKPEFVATSSE
ncbi:MAG: hypothetical protein F6K47_23470 [Symploca sp. SIO2E6]|nr:hypothetical protein [Symploca sp. SIO2E6]